MRWSLPLVLIAAGCSGAPAPVTAPVADGEHASGSAPTEPTCDLRVVHSASGCEATARGERCLDLDHWGARVDGTECSDWRAVHSALDTIAKRTRGDGSFSAVLVRLDADPGAPYASVQSMIHLCDKLGLYKIEFVGMVKPDGPERPFAGKDVMRVALFWDDERRRTVTTVDGALVADREKVHAIVRGFSAASLRATEPLTLVIDAATLVPWKEVLVLASIGRGAKVEFAAGEQRGRAGPQ